MQSNINVDYNQTVPVVCEECGNPFFKQSLVIRKVPGILVGQKETSYIPIPVFACDKCAHVNEEFQPKQGTSLE